eukprot:CFRG3424T1
MMTSAMRVSNRFPTNFFKSVATMSRNSYTTRNVRFLSTRSGINDQSISSRRTLSEELHDRGLWNQCTATPEVFDKYLTEGQRTVYCGFDPTADSLHVGNLLMIVTLLHFSRAGHNTIAIVGGATGRVGDPSGRTSERDKMAEDRSVTNLSGIERDLRNVFWNAIQNGDGHTAGELSVVDNAEWYRDMTPVTFFNEIGRHMRLNHMLARESVKSRLDSPEGISFAEFSYQALQAYDFSYLNSTRNCTIQLGGSDQWGNITAGTDLIRRTSKGDTFESYGLTVPLLTTAAGVKFGKSMGNAVWLNGSRTKPYEFFQFFINQPDSDVCKLLRSLTFIPLNEIDAIMVEHEKNPEKRNAQTHLAQAVTRLVHGEEGVQEAMATTATLFATKNGSIQEQTSIQILDSYSGAPTVTVPLSELGDMSVIDLVVRAGAVASKGAARRLINAKGLYLNNEVVVDPNHVLTKVDAVESTVTLLRTGKKSYTVVKWVK